jgi:5-hydroxyisourate hydrolase-like protein (transthyretin family)
MDRAQVTLQDGHKNPSVGVHIGLTLLQGGASLPITTETTDTDGRADFQVGEALAAGQYQYEVNVIDDGVFAAPLQISQFTIGTRPTILTAWSSNGNIAVALLDSNSQSPVPGRLLVLESQLKDGNWTIISTAYTDDNGRASFTTPASAWRVSFGGDTFYSPSLASTLSSSPNILTPGTVTETVTQSTPSVGNTLSNGHIMLSIEPDTITIYDPTGQTILGHVSWDVQVRTLDSWQSLPQDSLPSMTIDDSAGYHRVTLQGTFGNSQVEATQQFLANSRDPMFTPFRTPVTLQALGAQHSYRLLWHVESNSVASFQLEQRAGSQRTAIRELTAGSLANPSPSGENSMVALAQDGKTVLFGFNWDKALQYYQGTSLGTNGTQTTASVAFGTFTLSSGQSVILPACPCPDGGGGGGGSIATTTTLYLPSSAYATINTILKAQLKDQYGNPVPNVSMSFSKDGTTVGNGATNTTGYVSLVWNPGITGSHTISAAFAGNCCYLASSAQQSLTMNQTPTTTQILKPQSIVYSWDLYNYYAGNGDPIVVPVNILTLALSGSGSPANIYMPSITGNSTTPPKITGYGWAGLNSTSAVTVTFNSTYTQTQNMNWTRNFYLPPCPNPPNCNLNPRTGHMYLTASLSPPSTLYSSSTTSLNIPYQNVNSLSNAPQLLTPTIDGTASAFCGHSTNSCAATLTTSKPNDLVIAYAFEALDLQTSCTFSITDTAHLYWLSRASVSGRNDGTTGSNRDQIQEFYAKVSTPLSADTITESISGCASGYGGEYNGVQVFGISGANFTGPFDPNVAVPQTGSSYGTTSSVTLSTTNSGDMILGTVQKGSGTLTPGTGFTTIISTGGWNALSEDELASSPVTNFPVTFSDTVSSYWEAIGDAVQPASAITQSAVPPSHLYINVNASYPYISTQMQTLPIALAAYNAQLAYSIGPPTGSSLSGGYTIYTLPGQTDFARVCYDSACASPASNVNVYLYNSSGQYCGVSGVTNNRGIASIHITGSTGCTWPYSSASIYTSGNTLTLTELFQIEAVSNPAPFYTNFQGYNYATYAPQRTGRYLLHMYSFFLNSPYTILYPSTSYPDVPYPYLSCCDIMLNVEKHPLQAQATFNPNTATIFNNINATIQIIDKATSKPLSNSAFSYTLTRNDPNPGTVQSGTLTTNVNGTAILSMGLLAYGNYTLSVSTSATSMLNALSSSFSFTVYKAIPTLILTNISALATATSGMIKNVNPAGSPSPGTLSIIHSQSKPYEFYAVIGTSTDLLSPPQNGQTATCVGNPINCVSIQLDFSVLCGQPGCFPMGYILSGNGKAQWVNGQPNGISCASGFTSCSQSVTQLTGTSNICGTQFCYRFSVFVGSISYISHYWLRMSVLVADGSGTQGTFIGYGYVFDPDGTFRVNGTALRHSDAITPFGNAVTFQFNATSSPNQITSVTMNILNQTSSTNSNICLIGSPSCLQTSRTTNQNFLLYSPNTIIFTPGTYTVTITFACSGCGQTPLLVLTLVLVIPQRAWIQNTVAGNTYEFEASLVNNATGTQVIASGLLENVYVNGILYKSFQTDSMGNTAFTWTPSVAGQYKVTIIFYRQSYYAAAQTISIISVAHRTVILAQAFSPQNPDANQPVTWSIVARDLINNATVKSLPVSQYVDGGLKATYATDSLGTVSFTYSFPTPGTYNVTFVSAMNGTYASTTIHDPTNVFLETSVTLQGGSTIILGQQGNFTLMLKDSAGNPITGRTLQITVNGGFYQNVTTDSIGNAQFSWRPDNTGSYSVTATFPATIPGDSIYKPSSGVITVTVSPKSVVNSQSTGITQSVTLAIAGGSPQTPPPSAYPSITFGGDTIYIQLAGISGSLRTSSDFGWNCVARVFGACVLSVPYWNLHLDIHIQSLFFGVLYNVLSLDSPSITVSMPGIDPQFPSFLSSTAFWQGVGFAGAVESAFLIPVLASIVVPGVGEAAALAFTVGFPLAITVMNAVAYEVYQQQDRQKFFAGVLASIIFIGAAGSVDSIFSILARTAGKVPGIRDILFRGVMFAALITGAFLLGSSS